MPVSALTSMRKVLLVTAVAFPLFLSCGADLSIPQEEDGGAKRRITLRSTNEGIKHLDLLVFRREDGVLTSRESIANGDKAFSIVNGRDYNLYLFGNAPEGLLDGILYEGNLAETILSLEDDDITWPVMFGAAHLDAGHYDSPIEFSLGKYISKVTLGSVTVKWLDEYDYTPACSISRIGLVNVTGSIPLVGGPYTNGTWHNCGEIEPSLPEGLAGKIILSSPVTVTGPSAIPMNVSFYAMPNPLDSDGWGLPWSPRRTRLTLELIIEGIPNWYPVDLPAMECGYEYLIKDLIITGPGSSGPDEMIERSKIELSIEVNPWETESLRIEFE